MDASTRDSAAREQHDNLDGQSSTNINIMHEQKGFTAFLQRLPKMDMAGDDFARQEEC
jgi:hypothetical protein